MAEEQPRAARPEGRRRLHVVALLDGEHLTADDARVDDPPRRGQAQDDVPEAEADDGVDRHREQDERERELDVGDPHEHGGGPALDEPRGETEEAADPRGDEDRARADEEREPRAVEDAREEVAAELVGAERVAGRARRPEALDEVGRERVVGGEPRRQEGGRERRRGETDPEPFFQRSRTRGSSQP